MPDPVAFYDLESFVFGEVRARFHSNGWLGAFDFFAIVIWKANRAKSIVARRLLKSYENLEVASRQVTSDLSAAPDDRSRLEVLMKDHGFLLPMASAILAVLWPSNFTVYDIRVCDELGSFYSLGNKTKFDAIWPEYQRYKKAVEAAVPNHATLRDKDRYLWGNSAMKQLENQVKSGFVKSETLRNGADG